MTNVQMNNANMQPSNELVPSGNGTVSATSVGSGIMAFWYSGTGAKNSQTFVQMLEPAVLALNGKDHYALFQACKTFPLNSKLAEDVYKSDVAKSNSAQLMLGRSQDEIEASGPRKKLGETYKNFIVALKKLEEEAIKYRVPDKAFTWATLIRTTVFSEFIINAASVNNTIFPHDKSLYYSKGFFMGLPFEQTKAELWSRLQWARETALKWAPHLSLDAICNVVTVQHNFPPPGFDVMSLLKETKIPIDSTEINAIMSTLNPVELLQAIVIMNPHHLSQSFEFKMQTGSNMDAVKYERYLKAIGDVMVAYASTGYAFKQEPSGFNGVIDMRPSSPFCQWYFEGFDFYKRFFRTLSIKVFGQSRGAQVYNAQSKVPAIRVAADYGINLNVASRDNSQIYNAKGVPKPYVKQSRNPPQVTILAPQQPSNSSNPQPQQPPQPTVPVVTTTPPQQPVVVMNPQPTEKLTITQDEFDEIYKDLSDGGVTDSLSAGMVGKKLDDDFNGGIIEATDFAKRKYVLGKMIIEFDLNDTVGVNDFP
jgi:hypothetical protein